MRASFYASYKYGALKTILRKVLDFEPLPNVAPIATQPLHAPRFARNVRDPLHHIAEDRPPLFNDTLLASAAMDRLLHHAHAIHLPT